MRAPWAGFGLVLLWLFVAQTVNACQVCIPFPIKTLADKLIEAEAVVLASEDPNRPFHYSVVEILKGDPGDAPIDAFLNSKARRSLALDPERHMVLARRPYGRDWSALGVTDTDFERVVRRIIEQGNIWKPGETNNRQRLSEFTTLLGHPDSRLHELAYLEIGRAPYDAIRQVSSVASIDTVRDMLDNPRYVEWRGLAILMLAQSERETDRARIITTFDEMRRLGSTLNLAAWATAYLAIEGAAGVERIRHWYLERPDCSRAELKEVVKALSAHAAGDSTLRELVVAAYRALLEIHPLLASSVTGDLIAWNRWEFAEQIGGIRATNATDDPLGAYVLNLYLRRAAHAISRSKDMGNPLRKATQAHSSDAISTSQVGKAQ
jgi:hypothetical protein